MTDHHETPIFYMKIDQCVSIGMGLSGHALAFPFLCNLTCILLRALTFPLAFYHMILVGKLFLILVDYIWCYY